MDVAIASCLRLPEPDADASYYLDALARAGLSARVLGWDDPAATFDEARVVVIRSTWNYVHHLPEFLAWADRMGARLHNPPQVVRWNAHKRYLVELAEHGMASVPTRIVARGTPAPELAALGWADVVVKPAVSAGSFETRRLATAAMSDADRAWLGGLCAARDVLIQPFVASVDGYGERSIITFDGELSHAIRKSPRFHDAAESVSTEALPIAEDEGDLARRALAYAIARCGVGGPLLYGRVDMARDAADAPMIMELELIEPSLFFRQKPAAADVWAQSIARRLAASA